MDKWTYSLRSKLTRDEIFDAVDDRGWQKFRLSLKGLPTELKLDRLFEYFYVDTESLPFSELKQREIRVSNYLAALRRGGQLNQYNEVVR